MKIARQYQKNAKISILKAVGSGNRNLLLCLATGLGKTFCAVDIASEFKKTIFIVDREELCEQAAIAFIKDKFDEGFATEVENIGFIQFMKQKGVFPGNFRMGLIKADTFEIDADVIIASQQTLHKRLSKIDPNMFQLVIVDEAHGFLSRTGVLSVQHFTPELRLGLTATPTRADGLQLSDLFEEIAYEYNIGDGIKDGYLVELDAIKIKTTTSLDKVRTTGGELNQGDLSDEVNTPARNYTIADAYLKYCNGTQAIGFCASIQHAIDITEAFREKGINAEAVSSDEKQTGDRSEKIKLFRAGKINVLFNVGILTTGFDAPEVATLIMARPTKSLTLFMQMIGRGTRTLKGVIDGLEIKEERWAAIKRSDKRKTIILDVVDNSTRHNLINCSELDKGKDPEDRIFITEEKREKLLTDREQRRIAKIQHVQKEDERITLFSIPKLVISKSFRMSEAATPAQLAVIDKWGYPVKDTYYTKTQIAEIFGAQECSEKQRYALKMNGYEVEGFISVSQAAAAFRQIEERKAGRPVTNNTTQFKGRNSW